MLKRTFCIVTSLTLFLIIAFSPLRLSSHASKYEHISPYSDFKFSVDTSSYFYPNGFSDGQIDFYLIVATADGSSFKFRLFTITDKKKYGVLKIQRDVLPSKTFLLKEDYGIHASSFVLPSSDGVVSFDTIKSFSDISGLVFDYYNDEKYPSYNGSATYMILASNVDIYDYQGRLLQCGNYDTFLKYFDYNLDASKINDYTSASDPTATTTAPAVTTSPSGSSGSSDETSKGIFDTVKNIFSKIREIGENIANLPQNIADKIGNFFTDLKNSVSLCISNLKDNILNGLEYLFKPSDNNFTEIQEIFDDKFKFASQITGFFKDFTEVRFLDKPPDTNITVYGQTVSFINWDLYDRYKGFVDTIIISCSYYFYIRRLIRRLPGIIGGFHT